MRTLIVFLLLNFCMAFHVNAQIVVEHVYDTVTYTGIGGGGVFLPYRISETEIKYIHVENSIVNIYNLDHTLSKTISIPMLNVNDNEDVVYFSTHLFDTDSTTLEYMVQGIHSSGNWGTAIYREDNTELFFQPHYMLRPNILVLGSSLQFPNVINTPQGAKLLLIKGNGSVKVWALPGTYYELTPTGELPAEKVMEIGMPAPNPTSTKTIIPVYVPYDAINPQLVVATETGNEIKRYPLNPGQDQLIIDTGSLPAGMYLFTVKAENGSSRTRKVMVN
jgi:hypothetical protein